MKAHIVHCLDELARTSKESIADGEMNSQGANVQKMHGLQELFVIRISSFCSHTCISPSASARFPSVRAWSPHIRAALSDNADKTGSRVGSCRDVEPCRESLAVAARHHSTWEPNPSAPLYRGEAGGATARARAPVQRFVRRT